MTLIAAQGGSLQIPAGVFRISGAAGSMPVLPRGATIAGEGPHASTLLIDRDFAGDVLAWDEAWIDGSAGPDSIDLARDAAGPSVTGLRITGSRGAPHLQNALVFYDRNDHVLLRDVEVDDIDGDCLSIGQTRHEPEAFMRESTFDNLKCFGTGASGRAAVTIGSVGRLGSDGSNEIDVYKLAIFDAPGQGVAIRNIGPGSPTRGIRFYGLRIEKTGAEGLAIGDSRDGGQVAGITVFDLTVVAAQGAALRIAAGAHRPQPYGIRISGGGLGPGNTRGLEIDNGRLIDIALDNIDAPIMLGPDAGSDIRISGNGVQSLWRITGEKPVGSVANPLELRSDFTLRGLPGASDLVGVAALKGSMRGGGQARLTMDGGPANAYNCFNPGYGQSYDVSIRVMVQDRDRPGRFFAWTVPTAVLSAWYGPSTANVTIGPITSVQHDAQSGDVQASADRVNGCLSLVVRAPPPAADAWAASALITYVRAP